MISMLETCIVRAWLLRIHGMHSGALRSLHTQVEVVQLEVQVAHVARGFSKMDEFEATGAGEYDQGIGEASAVRGSATLFASEAPSPPFPPHPTTSPNPSHFLPAARAGAGRGPRALLRL